MGRYDFRPLQVHRLSSQLQLVGLIRNRPAWYQVIGNTPPSEALVRTQPIPHRQSKRKARTKKPSKFFKPQEITYEEDQLRTKFFKDHPWELARPRMIVEDQGRDHEKLNWSSLHQPEKSLDGESVVQRQLWLQNNKPEMYEASAYDTARKEFYTSRLLEDTERRVAREEALHTGAQFSPSAMEIGMKLEDEEFERWKGWAEGQAILLQRAAQ